MYLYLKYFFYNTIYLLLKLVKQRLRFIIIYTCLRKWYSEIPFNILRIHVIQHTLNCTK